MSVLLTVVLVLVLAVGLVLAAVGAFFISLVARSGRNHITPKHVKSHYDVVKGRYSAHIEGDFVVFLIGAAVNNWTAWHDIAALGNMPGMLAELADDPESGFLGAQMYLGNPTMIIQYWRSVDHLMRYAKAPKRIHFPTWMRWTRLFKKSPNGLAGAGIYHETFKVRAGEYEAIYNNCVPIGLGRFASLVPASGRKASAGGRLGMTDGTDHAPLTQAYLESNGKDA